MYKTVIVVTVLAFALLCARGSPVAENDTSVKDPNSSSAQPPSQNPNKSESSTAATVANNSTSNSNTNQTASTPQKSGASSAGNRILFVQVFAIALVTRLVIS